MKKEIIVGIVFVSIVGIAFFRTIISTDSKKSLFPYRTKIYYSRIDGLSEGTDVTLKGIPFGYILSVDVVPIFEVPDQRYLEPNREMAIELTLAVKEPVTLWDNYAIRFKSKTIFSGKVIDIDPGFNEKSSLSFYNPIYNQGQSVPDFFPSGKYIDNVFETANAVLVENRSDFRTIVVDSREISDKLLGKKGTLPMLINTSIAYNELNDTLNDLSFLLKDARRYQEGNRKLESTHPIPFIISSSFFGNTTLTGRYVEPITDLRNWPR